MYDIKKEKRKFIRTKVKRLTSIIKNEGVYRLVAEDKISTPILINVQDISTGGLRIVSEYQLMKDEFINLTISDIGSLDSAIIKGEVTRSLFDDSDHTYDVSLRFITPNTDYLKQLIDLLKTD